MVKMHTAVLAIYTGILSLFLPLQAAHADTPDERHLMSLLRNDFSLNWIHPVDPSGAATDRKTVVHFHLLKDGSISGLKVLTPSSSPEFDKLACNAVLESVPILPLPISLSRLGRKEEFIDVEFTFDSTDLAKYWTTTPRRTMTKRGRSVTTEVADKQVVEASRLIAAGQVNQAEELLRKALNLDEVNQNAHLLSSKICLAKALAAPDPGQKFSLLRKALIHNPAYGRARAYSYELLRKSGKDPLSVAVRIDLANQLQSEGKSDEARVELKEASRISEKNADVTKALTELNGKINAELAIEKWKSTVARTGTAEAHAGLGSAYETQGKIEQAIAEYELALEKNPRDTFAIASLKRLRESGKKENIEVPVKPVP